MTVRAFMFGFLVVAMVVAGCGDDDATSTATSVSEAVDTPQLTWDGTDCSYAGPAEVTDGVVVVELVNTSDDDANVGVLKIDEGYTFDDVVELFDDPENAALPSWLSDMGTGGAVRAEPGETIAWEGALDAGEYALGCTTPIGSSAGGGIGLTVVEG